MARNFDGTSSQECNCGDTTAINNVANASMSFWINQAATGDRNQVGYYLSGTHRFHYVISGNIAYFILNNGSTQYGSKSSWNQTGWHHISCVFDGGGATDADKCKIYLNGVDQSLSYTGTLPSTTSSSLNEFNIGWYPPGNVNGKGDLAEVKLWKSSLTADQAKSVYYGGFPDRVNLVGYWPMGYGSPEPDLSGSGYNGTLVNSPAIVDHPSTPPPFGADISYAPFANAVVASGFGILLSTQRNRLVI